MERTSSLSFPTILSIAWAGVGIVLIFVYAPSGWQASAGVCMIAQVFAFLIVYRRLSLLRVNVFPDFLTVFLLFQLLNKSLTMVSLFSGDLYNEGWQLQMHVSPESQFQAEIVLLVAMVLFTVGWLVVERRLTQVPTAALFRSPAGLIAFYVVCMVSYFGLSLLAGTYSLGAFPDFLRYGGLGAVTALLCANKSMSIGTRGSFIPILMLLPLFYLAGVSGTKGEVIVVSMPIIVSAIKFPSRDSVLSIVALAVFVIGIVVPLSVVIRSANWESTGGMENIGLADGFLRVGDIYSSQSVLDVWIHNAVAFSHRASSADMGGLVMQLAESEGHIGSEPARGFFAIFVPRMLWPEKPTYQPGAWFTWYLGLASSPETATSSTAMMLGTQIYWMYGVLGLVLLTTFLGMIYAFVWQVMKRLSLRGMMGAAGLLALLVIAPRFEENNLVYAASSPIIYLVYSACLVLVERTLRPEKWPGFFGIRAEPKRRAP